MRLLVAMIVICLAGAGAAGEEVLLRDGGAARGRVEVVQGEVRVTSRTGTVSFPIERVAAIGLAGFAAEPGPAERADQGPVADGAGQDAAAAPEERDGPPRLAEAMNVRMDIVLEDATMVELLQILRAETGLNLAYTAGVVRNARPINLHLTDRRVLVILRLALSQTGLHAAARAGETLYVSHEPLQRGVRPVEVRDLMVDWGDARGDDDDDDDDDEDNDYDGGGREARAGELKELLEGVCGRRSFYYRGRLFILPEGARPVDEDDTEDAPVF